MTEEVQRDAAEGLGVSPNSLVPVGGGRGASRCAPTKDGGGVAMSALQRCPVIQELAMIRAQLDRQTALPHAMTE
jgi:hypothetical protein